MLAAAHDGRSGLGGGGRSGCCSGEYHLRSLACHQPGPCGVSLTGTSTPRLRGTVVSGRSYDPGLVVFRRSRLPPAPPLTDADAARLAKWNMLVTLVLHGHELLLAESEGVPEDERYLRAGAVRDAVVEELGGDEAVALAFAQCNQQNPGVDKDHLLPVFLEQIGYVTARKRAMRRLGRRLRS